MAAVARYPARVDQGPTLHRLPRPVSVVIAWSARREFVTLAVLWSALALGLAAITTRVADWFVMTNELLYERRAISSGQLLSPLPRVREQVIQSFDQLYPLLIAPIFRYGYVPHDLVQAHFLNAWIMSSACIPAFLLARRATGRSWAAYLVALLSVTLPWILYSSFLLTEVAAYPAFLWGVLGLQRTTAAPSARKDVLALLGIALAFFARTQFAILALVLPLAILAHEVGRAPGATARTGRGADFAPPFVGTACWRACTPPVACSWSSWRRPAGCRACSGSTATRSAAACCRAGPASGSSFTWRRSPSGWGSCRTSPAWPGCSRTSCGRTAARSCTRSPASGRSPSSLVTLQVTIFDIRFGVGFVHDRYLFYVVPVVLLGFVCALIDVRRPRWSLLLPTGLVAGGFALMTLSTYRIVNSDTPVSVLNDFILRVARTMTTARVALSIATILLALLFAQAAILLRRSVLTGLLVGLLLFALPAETAYTFVRFFRVDGWSGRPLTLHYGATLDWVDKAVGTRAGVTMISYPTVPGDFWGGFGYWRDLEFWNKSVRTRCVLPRRHLRVDREHVPQAVPAVRPENRSLQPLADAIRRPGRERDTLQDRRECAGQHAGCAADRRRQGLANRLADLRPHRRRLDEAGRDGAAADLRLSRADGASHSFSDAPGLGAVQRRQAALPGRLERAEGSSDATNAHTVFVHLNVCVPAQGFTEVRLSTPEQSTIYGDMRDRVSFEVPRQGGVFVAEIALADELGKPCSPAK